MKAVIFAALIATAIVLMGTAQAVTTTDYIEIDTVLLIYKHYDCYGDDTIVYDMDAAEVSAIETQAAEAVEIFWRASNLRVHFNILETIVIERELTIANIGYYGGPNKHWMGWGAPPGQTTSVEDDLYDAGYSDGDDIAVWVASQHNRLTLDRQQLPGIGTLIHPQYGHNRTPTRDGTTKRVFSPPRCVPTAGFRQRRQNSTATDSRPAAMGPSTTRTLSP